MIRFACPKCGARLSAKEDIIGQTRQCPKCNTALVVPSPETAGQPPSVSLPAQSPSIGSGAGEAGTLEQDYAAVQRGPAAATSAVGAEPQAAEGVAASPLAAQRPAETAEPHAADQTAKKRLPLADWPQRLNRNNCYLICGRHKIVAAWQNNGEGWMLKSGSNWISAIRNRDQLPTQGDFVLVELKFSEAGQLRKLVGLSCYKLSQRWALTTLDKGDDQIMTKIVEPGCLNKDQKAAVRSAIKEMFMHQLWEDAQHVWEFLGNTDYHSSGVG